VFEGGLGRKQAFATFSIRLLQESIKNKVKILYYAFHIQPDFTDITRNLLYICISKIREK